MHLQLALLLALVFSVTRVLLILSPSSDHANPVATLILSPSSVQVRTGESLTLNCSFQGIRIFCYTVTWFRVHPRTREMDTSTRILVDADENYANECKGTINNTKPSDSGMYYCSVVHNALSFFSNGSLLTVTGTMAALPSVHIFSPLHSKSHHSAIQLLCWVRQVTPSQVRVSWTIDGQRADGWTGSKWTNGTKSATEFTQSWVTVPDELWDRGAECVCVAEYAGKTMRKTVQRKKQNDMSDLCHAVMWIYKLLGIISSILFVVIVAFTVYVAANTN